MRSLREIALRPSTWVAITVLTITLVPSSASSGPSITVSDLALGVAIALAGVQLLKGTNAQVLCSVPALCFWVLGAVSLLLALVAPDFPQNLVGGVRFLELFCLVPIAVMVALRSRSDAHVVLGSIVGLAVVEGALGVVQALTGTGAEIGGESIRAVGTFGAYNIGALAGLCSLAFVICLALGVVLTGVPRWWALGTAAFLVLPLVFSLSRSTWVATAVAALIVVSRGRPVRMLAVAVSGVVLMVVALPVVLASGGELADRVESVVDAGSEPDQSVVDRLALWEAATEMAWDYPWTGVGPRSFVEHRDAYADLRLLGSSDIAFGSEFDQVALESPHNFYLLVASEQGLVAAALFVVSFLVLLCRGLVRAARPGSGPDAAVALAGTGTLVLQLVGMLTGDLGGPSSLTLAITLGLAGWAAADTRLLRSRRPLTPLTGSVDRDPDIPSADQPTSVGVHA